MSPKHDADVVRRMYETDANLRIRQETHDKYTVPQVNYVEWVLHCVDWRGDEVVLDMGCGPGAYYAKLQEKAPDMSYYGVDRSPGILARHPAPERVLSLGDANHIPFADNTFDVVMANHMLYHMEDIDHTISELRRVMKPDGLLMAATNSTLTMPELQVLLRRAIVLLTRQGAAQVKAPALISDAFALENGTRILAQHFFAVVRHDLPNALVFPDVEPAMAYLESTRDLREAQLPTDVAWEDVMMIMRQQVNQLIKHLNELVINKLSGVLIATDRGGFIQPYIDIQQPRDGA